MSPENRVLLRRSARVAITALTITLAVCVLLALGYWFVLGSFFFGPATRAGDQLDFEGAAALGAVAILAESVLVYIGTAVPMIWNRFYPGQRAWGFVMPVILLIALIVAVVFLALSLFS